MNLPHIVAGLEAVTGRGATECWRPSQRLRFVDDAAMQAHGQSGHYRVFSASFETWLAGPPHVVRSRNLDVGE
ncbi:hypothetical protein CVO96_19880 [Deinococcus koreensis]|uniref:Uncharacterized protein n=1 Tax=Deinococcus koreensis TaxID=2054903 RepID=A0A2K3US83_9DEIO|nr:hypothetical protein CVO96_19880 [Deinococcus koreensis]